MDRLSDYDYELPEELIAQTPLEDRAASRLLHLDRASGQIFHRNFGDVLELLVPGDLLVMNDTRVSARRLWGKRATGGSVEILLLKEAASSTYEALCRPAKRLRVGAIVNFHGDLQCEVVAEAAEGQRTLRFSGTDVAAQIQLQGLVPLPPYIHETLRDEERYQTAYSANPGSAAAPTAGLHFTVELLSQLRERGIQTASVTLDVGPDTFRPVASENLDEHAMHGELATLPEATVNAIERAPGRIIAVGTTTVRTLESFAVGRRQVESGQKQTKLFVRPGFTFQIVDGMFTNFHLPRTTMLMMVSAMCGHEVLFRTYEEAVRQKYRFLSFGDSMLVL